MLAWMNDELEETWKETAVAKHFPGETVEKEENRQDILCPSRNSNQAPPEYKSIEC
jgi:hypothetical protein